MEQMKTVNHADLKGNIGNYIRFGGMGIVDGLSFKKCKHDFYKIIDMEETGLLLKQYRRQKHSVLPIYNFNQTYEIITKKEFGLLPVY